MSGYDQSRIVGMSNLDEFMCGICQMIFNNPVVTHCCRQTYCKACIDEWLSNHNNCPNDRQLLRMSDLKPVPLFASNLLNNLKIKCEYEERGCKTIKTISELSKHQKECQFRPNIECMTCGSPKVVGEEHDCIAYLIIRNNSIVIEMERLQKENQELKNSPQNIAMGMSGLLQTVRNSINDFSIERPLIKITSYKKQVLIDLCQEAILVQDCFEDISRYLSSKINSAPRFRNSKPWHVFTFSKVGGESLVCPQHYFRIEFCDLLVIEVFTSESE